MRTMLKLATLALALASTTTAAVLDRPASRDASLRAPSADLESLRAGAVAPPAALDAAEREALHRAAAASVGLDDIHVNDHDVLVICLVVVAVVLLIVIL